ncbi:Tyrosine recombinase XerD [Polaribacter huanghezhanensis]|uniref:tyrosine-type recombinase/integrase n=1 Tax=Polaribacter huanghezhanensis TaxID=1354726 RepID=UPI002649C238|nr:tyrosine-type recombinase/integrase [Polaribacter huanghezhanensis]WKD85215.1 Tyrosine recombinase XerD [Polaribacter huanghezhanensis]
MNIELLLEDFCHYSTYIRGVSKNTIRRYRQNISHYARASKITLVSDITEKNVQTFFLEGRMLKNWKATTYRTYYMTLLVFFRWCIKNGHLEKNYAKDLELPIIEKSLPTKLKKQEALRLLEFAYNYPYTHKYLKYRNHALFSMFLFAGLRKSELLNLKLNDVDLENLTIFVRLGKGNKDRIIPMSCTLAQSLNRYLLERKKLYKTCPEFFTSSNRNSGFTSSGLKLLVNQLKKASGLQFTIHKLRHTFATLMLEGGCDIYSLSKMMGHSDIKTTTIYLSATTEHLRSQIAIHPLNDNVHL